MAAKQTYAAVIIPTRGRDVCVRDTLRDLFAQEYRDFEVWLVDQNDRKLELSDLDTRGIAFHHETMPPKGSHAGRNHAIFKTNAALSVFVDDDVRVPTDFLGKHVAAYQSGDKNLGAVAGRVIQPRDGLTEEQMRAMGSPARYNSWIGKVSGNFVGNEAAVVHHIHECNFSVWTKVLRDVGAFNEEFKGNAYFEGTDLALRMIKAGFEIVYHPEITLTHLQDGAGGNRESDKAKHTYWYMRNYGLLNSLHMKAVGLPVFVGQGLVYVLGKAVKNASPEIARQGLRGLVDGLKYFRG